VCVTIAERSAILLVLCNNQTDQGDETEGLEREGLKIERYGKGQIGEGGVKRLFIV
jgi:hypothetical protein